MVTDKQQHFYLIAKATAAHMGCVLDEETDEYLKQLIQDGLGSVDYFTNKYPNARNHFIEQACLSLVNAVAMTVSDSEFKPEEKTVISMKTVFGVKARIKETKTEDLRCRPWCHNGFGNV